MYSISKLVFEDCFIYTWETIAEIFGAIFECERVDELENVPCAQCHILSGVINLYDRSHCTTKFVKFLAEGVMPI